MCGEVAAPQIRTEPYVLLITLELLQRGGREQLSQILQENLRNVTGGRIEIFRLSRISIKTNPLERLLGRIDGVTAETEACLLNLISQTCPDCIFIDGSNLGRIAKVLHRAGLRRPIVTFYHNVESRFFLDALRVAPSLRALGALVANTIAERWAAQYSRRRVFLSERDASLHARIYCLGGTDVLPMVLRDEFDPEAALMSRPLNRPYALFVGSNFYANVEGMAWYAEHVAPYAALDTVVIGRGMDKYRAQLERWGGVYVVGEVDELARWYAHAQIIVAPILSGSGMKTKTAEALMHGKPIAGTAEAFVGYDLGPHDGLFYCKTPADFLEALHRSVGTKPPFDLALRQHYIRRHSEGAMRDTLRSILENATRSEMT